MGLTAVVENLRALKKTVKKPIVALRETVHNAYTKAYVGSPERVDEFYAYIKVYQPSQHNDLCMMSITADINRFSMLPDKHTFFHVHKLERHFDRMIASRKQPDVNGDMAIQILSGHNMTFMARYRRYKTRATAKEAKRNAKRQMALDVKRHLQVVPPEESAAPAPVPVVPSKTSKTVSATDAEDKELAELSKAISEVVMTCELTKPETVVAVEPEASEASEAPEAQVPAPAPEPLSSVTTSRPKAKKVLKTEKTKVVKKFKVAKPVGKSNKGKKLENVMAELSLENLEPSEQEIAQVTIPEPSKAKVPPVDDSSDNSEFENLSDSSDASDDDDDDGSDIEELEKIEEKDVDDLEYEMI